MLLMGRCLDEANIRQRVLVRVKRVRRRIIAAGLQIIGVAPQPSNLPKIPTKAVSRICCCPSTATGAAAASIVHTRGH